MARKAELAEISRLAYILDESIRIPGLGWRIGLDGILGLIPGIGDFLGLLPSTYIIYKGWTFGVDYDTLMTMVFNVLIEAAAGTIPIVGDLFDFVFKANTRNILLIEKHLAR